MTYVTTIFYLLDLTLGLVSKLSDIREKFDVTYEFTNTNFYHPMSGIYLLMTWVYSLKTVIT